MVYSPEEFEALLGAVENQGGAHLPDPCKPQPVIYEAPPYKKAKKFNTSSCGCNNASRFVTVYDPKLPKRVGGSGYATACAVCDSMGLWPRYTKAVMAASPDEPEDEGAG